MISDDVARRTCIRKLARGRKKKEREDDEEKECQGCVFVREAPGWYMLLMDPDVKSRSSVKR